MTRKRSPANRAKLDPTMSLSADTSRIVLAAVLTVALAACAQEPPASGDTSRRSPFQVGQPFPDLTLPALDDGRPASMRDYRGQKVVLHVFASW